MYKILGILLLSATPLLASVDVDVFSRHVWRGQAGPSAVSIQPTYAMSIDNNVGATGIEVWGQIPITGTDTEYDFTLSQALGEYGSLSLTSYYYDGAFLKGENHDIEVGLSTTQLGIDFFVGRFINGDDVKDDMYVEIGYSIDEFDLSVGIGDGSYTVDGDSFAPVSVGIGVSDDDGYGASLIYNPDSEATFFIVSKSW
jgi:hypothetical protein